MIFILFPYKKFFEKKKFAYLPTLKHIGMFPETRHVFFFGLIHTCHISHCEIKSHRIFRPSYNTFFEEININHTLLCLSQASYI